MAKPDYYFVDTHAHLTFDSLFKRLDEVLVAASQQKVGKIITIGTGPGDNEQVIELAARQTNVWAAVGYHPHEAMNIGDGEMRVLEQLASMSRVVAIGEIGLDYVKGPQDRERQKQVFENQLSLAKKLNLPVVIHNREAHEDMLRILESSAPLRGVMHCFSGDKKQALGYIDLGLHLGVNGIVTFPNADELRDVVKAVPLESLLLETDCPYLAPQPKRGQTNEPAYVPLVAGAIAEVRDLSIEAIARQTSENAENLFQLN